MLNNNIFLESYVSRKDSDYYVVRVKDLFSIDMKHIEFRCANRIFGISNTQPHRFPMNVRKVSSNIIDLENKKIAVEVFNR